MNIFGKQFDYEKQIDLDIKRYGEMMNAANAESNKLAEQIKDLSKKLESSKLQASIAENARDALIMIKETDCTSAAQGDSNE